MTISVAPDHPGVCADQPSVAHEALPLAARSRHFHIPSLDGIRAVAVIIVFLAHAGADWVIPGGFGVTVFFFLSGYLITSLLRHEYERTGGISFKKFYLRRVLRIWPSMYLTLTLALVLCAAGVIRAAIEPVPLLFQCGHMTNLYRLTGEGHFIPGTSVLWSLAVEEHFYLLFPLAFLLLVRRFSRKQAALILLGACAIILAWRCILVLGLHVTEARTYKGTDTRVDSILFGCILGLYHNPYMDSVRLRHAGSKWLLLGVAAVLLLVTFTNKSVVFRETFRYTLQGLALLPVFYMAIIHSDWPLFAWLNWKPLRAVGLMSYTIYLVHYYILHAVRHTLSETSPVLNGVVAGVVILAIAAGMYYAVERPCAMLRKRLHA